MIGTVEDGFMKELDFRIGKDNFKQKENHEQSCDGANDNKNC